MQVNEITSDEPINTQRREQDRAPIDSASELLRLAFPAHADPVEGLNPRMLRHAQHERGIVFFPSVSSVASVVNVFFLVSCIYQGEKPAVLRARIPHAAGASIVDDDTLRMYGTHAENLAEQNAYHAAVSEHADVLGT
jgi:hypothetical protein